MGRYPYLIRQDGLWYIRIVVPADVRPLIGKNVFKIPTGQADPHKAAVQAAPEIARIKATIKQVRNTGKQAEALTADVLAERYRREKQIDPGQAELTRVTDIIRFVLNAVSDVRRPPIPI
jgi:hypothetical protein